MPLPEAIQNAPEFLPGMDYYYEAFMRLSSSRDIGQAHIGAIPYEAISLFCRDEGLEGDDRVDMFYHVEHLDAVYIGWQMDKIKSTLRTSTLPAPAPNPKGRKR
jgi:hypothetical protein